MPPPWCEGLGRAFKGQLASIKDPGGADMGAPLFQGSVVPVTFIPPSLLDSIRSDIASGSDSLIKPRASARERGLQGTVGTGKPGPARLEPTSATPPPTGACPPRPPKPRCSGKAVLLSLTTEPQFRRPVACSPCPLLPGISRCHHGAGSCCVCRRGRGDFG